MMRSMPSIGLTTRTKPRSPCGSTFVNSGPWHMSSRRIATRIAHEQNPITAEQRDRAVWCERNVCKEFLEVLKLDCTHDQAEELAFWADKLACDKDRPGPASPTEDRLAHKRRSLRVRFKRLEIVAVGHVERRNWPVTGKADELPLSVDQPDNINVRHALDLVLEHHMDVVTGHLPPIVLT